jgi:hypothetical protein
MEMIIVAGLGRVIRWTTSLDRLLMNLQTLAR